MPFALGQRTLEEGSRPSCCAGRKLGEVEQALLWTRLHEDPQGPSRVLRDQVVQRQRPMAVSLRPRNRWRAHWPFTRRPGRPRQEACPSPVASGAALVRSTPRLAGVGVHLFAHWLNPHQAFHAVVVHLQQAGEA
jgi:hypothetical protein